MVGLIRVRLLALAETAPVLAAQKEQHVLTPGKREALRVVT